MLLTKKFTKNLNQIRDSYYYIKTYTKTDNNLLMVIFAVNYIRHTLYSSVPVVTFHVKPKIVNHHYENIQTKFIS